MANTDDRETHSSLKLVGEIFGLFTGLVTLVYLAGGFVLGLRMSLHQLPVLPVVGQLPKEFLISMGISQVLLPALVVGGLYVLYRLRQGPTVATPAAPLWSSRSAPEKRTLLAGALTIACLLLLIALPVSLVRIGWDWRLLFLPVALAVTSVTVWAGLEARARIRAAYSDSWNGAQPIALMSAVAALCAIPPSIVIFGLVPLSDAQICASGGIHYKGLFIGETDSRVYVGENVRPARIVSVPLTQVEELFLGEKAVSIACKKKQPSTQPPG